MGSVSVGRFEGGVARLALAVLLVSAVVLSTRRAAADDLEYTKLDGATVRVFSFDGVTPQRVRGASQRAYVLGVPDAGHGTGLLVSRDGLILTARHVVQDARIVAVQLPGEDHPVPARVVYSDAQYDHAFLVVSGSHDNFVAIPDRKPKLSVRQTVYVIGYPLDASRTRPQSQQGIVSGVLPDGSLQLGIALNPGNSGGPVVDAGEHLVGIAVARADPKAGAQGIGVAVPLERILPGYAKAQHSDAMKAARRELAHDGKQLQAQADLLVTLLTADDSNNAWLALGGKKSAAATSPSVDQRIDAALKASTDQNADVLSVAAAQLWNAAAVSMERGESPRSYLQKARDLAKKAQSADADVVKRSPFISFVLDDHEPTDVDAGLPAAKGSEDETSSNEEGAADPKDVLLRSLEAKKSVPMVRIGPTLGIITPFQLFGIGAVAKFMFGDLFNVSARYQYGLHEKHSDTTGSHLFDVLGGIAIGTWRSHTTAQLIVDVEHAPWTTIYHYVPGEIPSVHSLIAEAGVLSGLVNLQSTSPTLVTSDFVQQVFMLEGGLRYIYFYHASSPYLARSARSNFELSGHILAPPLGVPAHSANADGKSVGNLPGFNVDVAWDSVLSLGETEIGGGYFPAGGWIYFHLGWSYLFY